MCFIVLEALSRECRSTIPWDMLYADNLVIITESLVELNARYAAWSLLKGSCTHVEFVKRVLAQILSFATTVLTECKNVVVDRRVG